MLTSINGVNCAWKDVRRCKGCVAYLGRKGISWRSGHCEDEDEVSWRYMEDVDAGTVTDSLLK